MNTLYNSEKQREGKERFIFIEIVSAKEDYYSCFIITFMKGSCYCLDYNKLKRSKRCLDGRGEREGGVERLIRESMR